MRNTALWIAVLAATCALGQERALWRSTSPKGLSFGNQETTFAHQLLAADESLRAVLSANETYRTLRDKLHTVVVDGRKYFVAEGDLLLDQEELLLYAKGREFLGSLKEAQALTGGLIAPQSAQAWLVAEPEGDRIVRWDEGLQLTYRVDKSSFATNADYARIVQYMTRAANAWEQTCGVEFQHLVQFDEAPVPEEDGIQALFVVRRFDSAGEFIAAAFFPNDPVRRRQILIDPSLFSAALRYDPVGVLRHELGHVLGFRHEHIRSGAPPECPDESPGVELTEYDPQSVMHYFCGGVGTRGMHITQTDRLGAQLVYGQPRGRVRYFR